MQITVSGQRKFCFRYLLEHAWYGANQIEYAFRLMQSTKKKDMRCVLSQHANTFWQKHRITEYCYRCAGSEFRERSAPTRSQGNYAARIPQRMAYPPAR
jgi:hypothetical protein